MIRVGPRGLRRGTTSAAVQRERRALIASALTTSSGSWSSAVGLLVGCIEELVFRGADKAGPPEDTRPAPIGGAGAWRRAIGDAVLQPTSRVLRLVALRLAAEAENVARWSGEHIDIVQARISEASCLFGDEVADAISKEELRGQDRDGKPMSREEFDEELFERRVRELVGRAIRCQPDGIVGAFALALTAAATLHRDALVAGYGPEADAVAERLIPLLGPLPGPTTDSGEDVDDLR